MTVAVIVATARDADPAALTGLVDALAGRLAVLNVPDQRVLARPDVARALRAAGRAVTECAGETAVLREIARLARTAHDGLAVLPGDLATGDEVLARLLAARGAGALTVPPADGTVPVRTNAGLVVAAGSATHRVTAPDGGFPGALYVSGDRAGFLAVLADRIAGLVDDGVLRVQDPVPLLLVGLVRAGEPVTACPAGALPCLRPRTGEAARAALRAVAAADEDAARLAAAVRRDDGSLPARAVGALSPRFVRWAAGRGLTPHAVTGLSAVAAALAALWFSGGDRAGLVVGGALLLVAFTLDCADGQLARYTGTATPFGAWLDATADRGKEALAYAGLAVGAADPGVWRLAAAALVLPAVRELIAVRAPRGPRARSIVDPFDATVPEPGGDWLRRLIVLPSGERFVLVAMLAAATDARRALAVLVAWNAVAAAYALAARLARSPARRPSTARMATR
ncbi:CDP-alcohol phosphatidyltransferase family protein [Actinomadura rayongensis]|uniref:CDP-alcohol phosphatidyltransferase family protein n=1 Tax=Actinomadura rayongensis TaxID=1429076 RepID=A0A6I4W9C2_9ACTN|nr:CDP-alcohol phosphatidyltransferase family protein [Actinomadura rayongensis]MXQ64686.1 CDP-alcohol phosphatidyltransferase family protein [Actinomadura rayongensis]